MHPHLFRTLTSYTDADTEKLIEVLESVLDVDWRGQDGFGKFWIGLNIRWNFTLYTLDSSWLLSFIMTAILV
jgi:hypothetical protein